MHNFLQQWDRCWLFCEKKIISNGIHINDIIIFIMLALNLEREIYPNTIKLSRIGNFCNFWFLKNQQAD